MRRGCGPARRLRIGWLTPLLGVFVLLDLLSFWMAAWVTRDQLSVTGYTLLAVSAFASAYYLAARLVFPPEPDETPDLDAHFFRVRRIVLGTMFALLLCQLGWYASVPALAPFLLHPVSIALTAILAALMIAAMLVRGQIASRMVMLALVARYLVVYLL